MLSSTRPPAFAIAAARSLRDLVQPGFRAPDLREIEVDAGLDQRCGDQRGRARPSCSRSRTSFRISRRCAAYCRVVRWIESVEPCLLRLPIERQRMLAAVDDDQPLIACRPAPRRARHCPSRRRGCSRTRFKLSRQPRRVGRELPAFKRQAGRMVRRKIPLVERRLGRGAQHDGAAVVVAPVRPAPTRPG